MNDYEQWGVEVAAGLHARFVRSRSEHPEPVSEFSVGTSGPWLWAIYRLTDAFSGTGASAFLRGLVIDLRQADNEYFLMGACESLAEDVWFGDIADPQSKPSPSESVLVDEVWWRHIPPLINDEDRPATNHVEEPSDRGN